MTRDPAAQAVHERLENAAASMQAFDVDAGWSALAAQLEPPIAPVIPLRRRRPRRAMALGVAAAIVVGGSALAAVRHGATSAESVVPAVVGPGSALVVGPHVHGAFSGAPAASSEEPEKDAPAAGGQDRPQSPPPQAGDTTHGSQPSGGADASDAPRGGPNQDSPDDIDHGSGNDGQHDDNGGGNDVDGHSNPQGSNGNGGGSGGGDHGSAADHSNAG
jgi:hypothetical protein